MDVQKTDNASAHVQGHPYRPNISPRSYTKRPRWVWIVRGTLRRVVAPTLIIGGINVFIAFTAYPSFSREHENAVARAQRHMDDWNHSMDERQRGLDIASAALDERIRKLDKREQDLDRRVLNFTDAVSTMSVAKTGPDVMVVLESIKRSQATHEK